METRKNYIDAVTVAAKGVLGGIPVVGPMVAEVVGALIPNQRVDRICRLVEELRRRVADRIIEIYFEHVESEYAQWINPYLTLLRAEDDNRVVGCQIWFVRQIVDTAGACLDKAQAPKEKASLA
jgi:hypothetical protein